jgi:hypothetical protein
MLKHVALILLLTSAPLGAQISPIVRSCTQGDFASRGWGHTQNVVFGCTVTPYLTGTTTLATYSVYPGGPAVTGAFTVNTQGSITPQVFVFWAATGVGLDIVLSGGTPPNTYAQPVTLTDVVPGDSGGAGGGIFSLPYALIAEGESVPSGSTLPTTGDLFNLGTILSPGAVPPLPPFDAGPNGNMDVLSRLARTRRFRDAINVNNLAVGGTTCAAMEANYATNDVAKYGPNVRGGPNRWATTIYDFIWTGKNDSNDGTPLSSFEACMTSHLREVSAAGFTPVLMTMYLGWNSQTVAATALLESYNEFERSLAGTIVNGKRIKVIDIDQQFPPELNDSNFEQSVSLNRNVFTADSYQVTESGSSPTSTSTIVFTLDSESPGLIPYLVKYPALMIGGYNRSTALNYQHGTFVSASGSTVTATLANSLPSTCLVAEKGYFWSSAVAGSLHMGPVGYDRVAQYVSAVFDFDDN